MAAINNNTKDEAKAGNNNTGTAATDDSLVQTTVPPAPPWHAAYPSPQNSNPASISRAELLQILLLYYSSSSDDEHGHENGNENENKNQREKKKKKKNFVLIDLRRMDHEGGTIRGSINLPAQSLWDSIPSLYELFKGAGIEKVIWYCGSSRGRGPRAAGWFDDYIQKQNNSRMKSLTLAEGIKGWSGAGKEYTALMDGYEEAFWRKG